MQAGRRRYYIVFQSKTESANSYGEVDIVWSDDFNCFAEIKPLRGNEYYNARQIQSNISHKVVIQYATLSNGDRIKPSNCRIVFDDNRTFNIQSVINIGERNKELELMVVEEL